MSRLRTRLVRRSLVWAGCALVVAGGCGDDYAPNYLYRGEWVDIDGRGRSVEQTCGGTFAFVDSYAGALAEEFGVEGHLGQAEADDSLNASGALYVFTESNNEWTRQAYIKPSNPMSLARFGRSSSLSDDGDVLVVGAYTERSAGVGIDGDPSDAMLDSGAGAAYVFLREGTQWSQHAYIKANAPDVGDYFGLGVEISGDGRLVAVGAQLEDGAAVGLGGDQTDNAATDAGAVFLY